jgi:hypothetical protein
VHATGAAVDLLAAGVAPQTIPHRLRESAVAIDRVREFDPSYGSGHLWIPGAVGVRSAPATAGVDLIAMLRDERGVRGVGAVVAIFDPSGAPIRDARAYARMRGGVDATPICTTNRSGYCVLDGGAITSAGPVVVEIEAVVLDDGRVADLRTIASSAAIDAAQAATSGTGFGPSSIVWTLNGSFSSLFGWSGTTTYLLYGSGEGSALPPTVIALDQASVLRLIDASTTGTGFGPSSIVWVNLSWSSSFFLPSIYSISGTGFGPSSIDWSGWTFVWSPSLRIYGLGEAGSPLHDVTGAAFGRSTSGTASAEMP